MCSSSFSGSPSILAAEVWSWQAAFVAIGLVWLAVWMRAYRSPEEHPRLSAEEAALIRSDQEPPARTLNVPWQSR